MGKAFFVVSGDIETQTGGYIYDRRVIAELELFGWSIELLSLSSNFPRPTEVDLSRTRQIFEKLEPKTPVIIDGLVYGSLSTEVIGALRSPIIVLVHHPLAEEKGLPETEQQRLLTTELENLQFAQKIITPSNHVAEVLMDKYSVNKEKLIVAKPGLDIQPVEQTPVSPALILSVGIQTHRKGHDTLIRALSLITDLEWQAVIVGLERDPKYAQKLQKLRADLELESRVEILGEVPQSKLSELYSKASVFALATRNEGYGMVFDEAMSFGLPIVSCNVGAVTETVGDKAGLFVQEDSAEQFATALRTVLTNPSDRAQMAAAAKTRVESKSSWSETANVFARVLSQLKESGSGEESGNK